MTYRPPRPLPLLPHKPPKRRKHARVLGQHNVAPELEDARRRLAKRLAVERRVEDAWGAVLRVALARRVDEALLADRVRAEEGCEPVRLNGLVEEQVDELVGVEVDAREEAVGGGDVAVAAADEGADAGATGKVGSVGVWLGGWGKGLGSYRGQTTVPTVAAIWIRSAMLMP